jgi:hypothetical protein
MKICTKCRIVKAFAEFNPQKSHTDGLRSQCKSCLRQHYIKNRIEKLVYQKLWYTNNREYRLEYDKLYALNRLKRDPNYKLKKYLRTRINNAIKQDWKVGSAVKDLGCSIDFLKQYIESKFYSNMSWYNWGTVWELDHIKSLHKFDLTNRKEFLKVVHYTNLQPLTIEDHRNKTIKDMEKTI